MCGSRSRPPCAVWRPVCSRVCSGWADTLRPSQARPPTLGPARRPRVLPAAVCPAPLRAWPYPVSSPVIHEVRPVICARASSVDCSHSLPPTPALAVCCLSDAGVCVAGYALAVICARASCADWSHSSPPAPALAVCSFSDAGACAAGYAPAVICARASSADWSHSSPPTPTLAVCCLSDAGARVVGPCWSRPAAPRLHLHGGAARPRGVHAAAPEDGQTGDVLRCLPRATTRPRRGGP